MGWGHSFSQVNVAADDKTDSILIRVFQGLVAFLELSNEYLARS